MSDLNVPAGVIPPKVPRPLTDTEREMVEANRAMMEAKRPRASVEALTKLEEQFAKPNRQQKVKPEKKSTSAWG